MKLTKTSEHKPVPIPQTVESWSGCELLAQARSRCQPIAGSRALQLVRGIPALIV